MNLQAEVKRIEKEVNSLIVGNTITLNELFNGNVPEEEKDTKVLTNTIVDDWVQAVIET